MNLMEWKKCEREFIREVEADQPRVTSIIKQARNRLRMVQKIDFSEETISFIVENYYEVIKELLVAYLLKRGLRSKNHQCLFSYFYKEHPEYETEVMMISQMSYFRNRLEYYGESVPLTFYEKNKKKIREVIELLEKMV